MGIEQKIRVRDFSKQHDLGDNSFRNFLIKSSGVALPQAGFGGLGSRRHSNIREPTALRDTHILARIARPSSHAISPREALVWERKQCEILRCREEHLMQQYCPRHHRRQDRVLRVTQVTLWVHHAQAHSHSTSLWLDKHFL